MPTIDQKREKAIALCKAELQSKAATILEGVSIAAHHIFRNPTMELNVRDVMQSLIQHFQEPENREKLYKDYIHDKEALPASLMAMAGFFSQFEALQSNYYLSELQEAKYGTEKDLNNIIDNRMGEYGSSEKI